MPGADLLLAAAIAVSGVMGGGVAQGPVALPATLVWAALLVRALARKDEATAWPWSGAGACLLGFTALAFASLAVSVCPGLTLERATQYLTWCAAFWLAMDAARRRSPLPMLALVAAGAVTGVIGLQDYLVNARQGNVHWRTFSVFDNPNLFASYLLLALPAAILLALRATPWEAALLCGLVTAVMVGALLATGSRAAILCALPAGAIGLVLWLRQGGLREAKERGWRLLLLVAACVAVGWPASVPLLGRAQSRSAVVATNPLCAGTGERVVETQESNRFRLLTWAGTLGMIRARPLTGFGAGTFEYAYPRFARAGFTRRAHQSYLEFAADQGVIALLLWLGALGLAGIALLRRLSDEPWWTPAVGAALVGSAVHNLVEWSWYAPPVALGFWVVLGLAAGRHARSVTLRRRLWLAIPAVACVAVLGLAGAAEWQASAGIAAWRAGRQFEARDRALAAAQMAPWQAARWLDIARVEEALGNRGGARRAAERAATLAPTWARPPLLLARLAAEDGDVAAALAHLDRGLASNPHHTELLLLRGDLLRRRGDPTSLAEARATYRRLVAIERTPVVQVRALGEERDHRYALAHHALGQMALVDGDLATARSEFLRAGCALAERRVILEVTPLREVYQVAGRWDARLEADLLRTEAEIWEWLANDYAARTDPVSAAEARRLAEAARAAMRRLTEGATP